MTKGLWADVVILANGDRISGAVVSSDGEKIQMKTQFLGDVEIPWEAMVKIESDQKLYLSSEGGQVFVGEVRTVDDSFQVETTEAGVVTVPKSAVTTVRNEEAQEAYEAEIDRLREPDLLDFWGGYLDTGLSVTAGNAETRSFSTAARAERKTEKDKISVYATSVYAQNSTTGTSITTANAIRGGTRYDIDIREKLFTFAFVDLEFDEFQDLDLRNVVGGGLGYHIKNTQKFTFDFFGGGSFNQEFFTGDITRRSGEIVVGEEINYKFSERTTWTQRFALFPNLSESGEYRLQFDTSLDTQLFGGLGWQLTFSDRFLSNPVAGREKNDILLSSGIRLRFGRQ